jgi:glycerol-3-phosphate O-acyltransferase
VVDYMLRGFWTDGARDLVFVPLGLNYDRVLEDRTLLLSADPQARKPGRFWAAWNTLGFFANNFRLMLKSEWHRFGYACVNFGAPVSMREYCALRGLDFQKLSGEARKRAIGELGAHLMQRVGGIVPVVPVPLIAHVLLNGTSATISELELKSEVEQLIEKLERAGAHVYIPRKDLDYAVAVGLRMLRLRRLVDEADGLYSARPGELPLLRYYANSISHLLKAAPR